MYITSSIRTIRPVDTVRASFRPKRAENAKIEAREYVPATPQYLTEADVTSAIASGTFKGFAATAYAEAARYQAYLKSQQKRFFRKAEKKQEFHGAVFIPGYAN